MRSTLWILVAVFTLSDTCNGTNYVLDLDPFDEVACSEETRPRVIDASTPGLFTSPDFNISAGQLYPPNSLCEWQITQNGPGDLELRFLNFSLEASEQCKSDYVAVYDNDADGELVGTYCGQEVPVPIVRESGATLFVQFVSDDTVQYPGFMARYGESKLGVACEAGRPEVISANNGTLSSPNWPLDYEDDLVCEWKFEADIGNVWVIETVSFEVEGCCGCDHMEVFDGDSTQANRFGMWYGLNTLPPRIVTSGRDMYLTFNTDYSITYSGFLAGYTQVPSSEAYKYK